jgi:hypothetical protein
LKVGAIAASRERIIAEEGRGLGKRDDVASQRLAVLRIAPAQAITMRFFPVIRTMTATEALRPRR